MSSIKDWYLSWSPGAKGYRRDDIIVAVGMKCIESPIPLSDAIMWLGLPDKVCGNPQCGMVVYYFDDQSETVAQYDVLDGYLKDFGTITRTAPNTKRTNPETGEIELFNVLDLMDDFENSEMKNTPNHGLESTSAPPAAGTLETHP